MPKYDYKCDECNNVFELEHPMNETKDWHNCPRYEDYTCAGFLHKVFRPASTHFKGQGWGKTYRVHKGKDIK